jgi:hypothetical protein
MRFLLFSSIILFFLAGSSAATPLYAHYQAAWGITPLTVTIVFGVYALAVLAALLVFGALSDHVGRRPVLIATAIAQALAMVIFATAGGVADLIAARVLQGVATGAAAGAVGAGLLDLDRARGTTANAIAPMLGTATGALLSGVFVQLLPAPDRLVYLVLGAIFIVQAIGVVFVGETIAPRPGALASLRPQFRLPLASRAPMLVAAPALVAAWADVGFYGSLGPSLVRHLVGSSAPVLGGLALFVLASSGAITVYVTRARPALVVMRLGTGALLAGVALTLAAISASSTLLFALGAIVTGAGFGGAFQGSVRTVIPTAAPHQRAGLLSVVYVIAYLAMGAPAVLGGLRAVHGGGVVTTAREYGVAVMALAALALVGTFMRRARPIAAPA